jgi:hypothetical protein
MSVFLFSVCIVNFNIHGDLSLAIWFSCCCQMYLWFLFGLTVHTMPCPFNYTMQDIILQMSSF